MKKTFLACVLFSSALYISAFTACSSKPPKTLADGGPRRFLVFVPGFYGTSLWEPRSDDKVWITGSEALWGKRNVALPIPGLLENTYLVPGPILDYIRVIPGIYAEVAYGDAVEKLEKFADNNGMTFVPVPYDWRKSYVTTAKLLHEKIQALELNPEDEVYLVSHSMGSAITAYYIRYGNQNPRTAVENWQGLKNVKAVVMAGAPFRGTMAIFRNIHYGVKIATNKNILAPISYASFESSYYLLPLNAHAQVQDEDGKLIPFPARDAQTWKQNSWGISTLVDPKNKTLAEEYTQYWLEEGKIFLEKLQQPVGSQPPNIPLFYIFGAERKTVENGIWLKNQPGPQNVVYYPEDIEAKAPKFKASSVYADGDESVPTYSAMPLEWFEYFPHDLTQSDLNHGDLVSSQRGQKWIQEHLIAAMSQTDRSIQDESLRKVLWTNSKKFESRQPQK